MGRMSDDQRRQVRTLIRQGKGRNQIARETGVGQGSITRIAQAEGLSITPAGVDRARLKELTEAAQMFVHERRLRLYNVAADRAEMMLHDPTLSPKELQHVVTSLAILNDKYRVELGEAKVAPQYQSNIVVVVGDNGRGPLPAGAVQVHRSWPNGTT